VFGALDGITEGFVEIVGSGDGLVLTTVTTDGLGVGVGVAIVAGLNRESNSILVWYTP